MGQNIYGKKDWQRYLDDKKNGRGVFNKDNVFRNKKKLSPEQLLKKIENGESLKDYVKPKVNDKVDKKSLQETIKLMQKYNKK